MAENEQDNPLDHDKKVQAEYEAWSDSLPENWCDEVGQSSFDPSLQEARDAAYSDRMESSPPSYRHKMHWGIG